jgi:hypothetical protein
MGRGSQSISDWSLERGSEQQRDGNEQPMQNGEPFLPGGGLGPRGGY